MDELDNCEECCEECKDEFLDQAAVYDLARECLRNARSLQHYIAETTTPTFLNEAAELSVYCGEDETSEVVLDSAAKRAHRDYAHRVNRNATAILAEQRLALGGAGPDSQAIAAAEPASPNEVTFDGRTFTSYLRAAVVLSRELFGRVNRELVNAGCADDVPFCELWFTVCDRLATVPAIDFATLGSLMAKERDRVLASENAPESTEVPTTDSESKAIADRQNPPPVSNARDKAGPDVDPAALASAPERVKDRLASIPAIGSEAREGASSAAVGAEGRALALLIAHPELTDTEIAKRVGVNRTTLYKFDKFKAAKKALKSGRDAIPRGSKINKSVESWDSDDKAEDSDE
jgi:hypothetical protein